MLYIFLKRCKSHIKTILIIAYLLMIFLILNLLLLTPSFAQRALPDLFVDDIKMIQIGELSYFEIQIGNAGDAFPQQDVSAEVIIKTVVDMAQKNIKGASPPPIIKKYVIPFNKLTPGKTYMFKTDEIKIKESINLEVQVDPSNRIKESNEGNNKLSRTFAAEKPMIAPKLSNMCNLTISRIYIIPYSGGKVQVRIHILNNGTSQPLNDFQLILFWEPDGAGNKNQWSIKAKSMLPGREIILTSGNIALPSEGIVKFIAEIDPGNQVMESNETDNIMTREFRIPELLTPPDIIK